ncbi:MAG: hypothetical protein FJ398_04275 [Verrucomicrobia bacterium]|nr:hypothetical protein [Verrucomicrobiota bacterium]
MTKDEIKRRLEERPFRPFKVRVAGDGEYEVPSGDHVSLHPNGRLLFIHLDTGGTAIIDVPLITSVHIKETV